jgi:hypothetical protein
MMARAILGFTIRQETLSEPSTLLRAKSSDGADHRGATSKSPWHSLPASARLAVGRECPFRESHELGPDGTTQQHNTHIRDLREVCYPWHPWHGRAVWVHATLIKRGQAVAHCSLEDVQASRVLEVPLWMLDVAACCKTQVSKPGFASPQSLRDLKEILQALRPRVQASIAPETQPRYLLNAGGVDAGIDGSAEIEPTPVVCSSARQPTLDESVVRCSTKDSAIAGTVTEAASSNAGRGGNRRGGTR